MTLDYFAAHRSGLPDMAHLALFGVASLAIAIYLYLHARRQRFQKYKDVPHVPSSLLLGHFPAMAKRVRAGSAISKDPARHGGKSLRSQASEALASRMELILASDYIFKDMHDELGRPGLLMFDIRPLMEPMVVVGSHALAEQLSKSTKEHPYAYPKGPALRKHTHLIGEQSILVKEVRYDHPLLSRAGY